jgi:hypothetical protein
VSRRSRRTVAAFVKTRDGSARLLELLAQLELFADEIIVGVDEGSSDGTLELARRHADLVCRFRHGGDFNPAELLPLGRTRCDWILRIDDDERVDERLPSVLAELVADERYTHWYLPQLTVVQADPPLVLDQPPWHPVWVVRLFRAEPSLVALQANVHGHLRVIGLGGWESRSAVLHYEPLLYDAAGIGVKVARYASRGYTDTSRYGFDDPSARRRTPQSGPLPGGTRKRRWLGRLERSVVDLDQVPRLPGWRARIEIAMPTTAEPGEEILAEAELHNTGSMCWWPTASSVTDWPQLGLHFTIRGPDGKPRSGLGYPIPRIVAPGERAHVLCSLSAPTTPGSYTLDWDMASHDECWFAQLGSPTTQTRLVVTQALPNEGHHALNPVALEGLSQ